MSKFFDDTMKGLHETVQIEKQLIPDDILKIFQEINETENNTIEIGLYQNADKEVNYIEIKE